MAMVCFWTDLATKAEQQCSPPDMPASSTAQYKTGTALQYYGVNGAYISADGSEIYVNWKYVDGSAPVDPGGFVTYNANFIQTAYKDYDDVDPFGTGAEPHGLTVNSDGTVVVIPSEVAIYKLPFSSSREYSYSTTTGSSGAGEVVWGNGDDSMTNTGSAHRYYSAPSATYVTVPLPSTAHEPNGAYFQQWHLVGGRLLYVRADNKDIVVATGIDEGSYSVEATLTRTGMGTSTVFTGLNRAGDVAYAQDSVSPYVGYRYTRDGTSWTAERTYFNDAAFPANHRIYGGTFAKGNDIDIMVLVMQHEDWGPGMTEPAPDQQLFFYYLDNLDGNSWKLGHAATLPSDGYIATYQYTAWPNFVSVSDDGRRAVATADFNVNRGRVWYVK